MPNAPDASGRFDWLNPFEAGRQWIDIATKAQTVVLRHAERQAKTAGFQPFSPQVAAAAFTEFFANLLSDPQQLVKAQSSLWDKHVELWNSILTKDFKQLTPPPAGAKDRRFKNQEWDSNIALQVLKHSYLIGAEWLKNLVADQSGLSPSAKKQVTFFTQQYIDAAAPTNFALTNPEVLRKTLETRGANLVRGISNLLDDLATDAGHVRRAASEAFELGVNVAATKGAVILRTDMMELLQFEPSTEQTYKIPLLLIPPWVNKYYLFDLQPKTSFIKWAVDQGFTVFAISWVNPDSRHAGKDFENYWIEGPLAAFEAIENATDQRQINLFGYCLGGTLTAAGLAYLAERGDDRVSSATMVATMTDFTEFGDFEVFVTEEHVAALEQYLKGKGYLDSADLSRLFSMLRANDLIWSSAISSYLLADAATPSDLLYWFSDGIGMPAKMLSTFARQIILENALATPGKLKLNQTPIDLGKVKTPLCFVSLRDDHVVAWQASYRGALQFKAPKRFMLGGSGHNAGTINPPAAGKHGYWTNDACPLEPDNWLQTAQRHEGSWWPEWSAWLKERSGPEVSPRPVIGGPRSILQLAPGTYARMRS